MKKYLFVLGILALILMPWIHHSMGESGQGDSIIGFRIINVKDKELTFEIRYEVEPYHGNVVYIGGWIYNSKGQATGGYRPTAVSVPGKGKVQLVMTLDIDPQSAGEVEFFLYEPGKAPFIKRRFPLSFKTGGQPNTVPAPKADITPGQQTGTPYSKPKPEGSWEWIGAQVRALIQGGTNLYMINDITGDIFQYNGTPGSWTRIGGPSHSFSAGFTTIYALSADKGGIYQYSGKPGKWFRIHGAAGAIYAGGTQLYFTKPQSGDIYEYHPESTANVKYSKEGPKKIGGPGSMFSVNVLRGTLYGLSTDKKAIYLYLAKKGRWQKVGGPAARIYAGYTWSSKNYGSITVYAVHPGSGDIHRIKYDYETAKSSQGRIGGPAAEFAVGQFQNTVWGLSKDRSYIFEFGYVTQGSKTNYHWKKIGGPALKIFAGGRFTQGKRKDQLYIIDSEKNVWRYKGGDNK